MKRSIFVVAGFVLLSACGVLARLGNPAPEIQQSTNTVPAWDGKILLCGANVSFDVNATDPLPEYAENERLGFCTRSMKYLALHRQYGDKTTFFGIAAEVTGSFAILYAPFMRRVYTSETWDFAQQLNLALDGYVDGVVQDMEAGQSGGARFTKRTIAAEQRNVQRMLDALQASDAELYAQALSDFDGTFNPTNGMLLRAINSEPFFAAYEASLAEIRLEVGGNVDFSLLAHRLRIADALDSIIRNIAPYEEYGP